MPDYPRRLPVNRYIKLPRQLQLRTENVEQITDLTSEGIYYQLSTIFTKPVNVSLTMANDSFLKNYLAGEAGRPEDDSYIEPLKEYLGAYQKKYGFDSVFSYFHSLRALL